MLAGSALLWLTKNFPFLHLHHPHRLHLQGAQHNFEKNLIKVAWTPDGKHVGAGSADRNVYVWNYATTRIEYALPGHKGSVNSVSFHPKEPIGKKLGNFGRKFVHHV